MAQLFFFYLAGIIVLTSILVVALRNPVYSALSLLIMFFHVAGLYVTLHAEFVAAVQIIVYAGAILVLYLFVVMLLNLHREDRYHQQLPLGALLGVTILTEVILLMLQHGDSGVSAALPVAVPPVMGDFPPPGGGPPGAGPFGPPVDGVNPPGGGPPLGEEPVPPLEPPSSSTRIIR